MILGVKTDDSTAQLVIATPDGEIIREKSWSAQRTLARDLDKEITQLTDNFNDRTALIVYEGPGSFTGLRIGITVANAISYARNIPIVGTSGETWFLAGMDKLRYNKPDNLGSSPHEKPTEENGVVFSKKSALEKSAQIHIVVPNYGDAPHITKAK